MPKENKITELFTNLKHGEPAKEKNHFLFFLDRGTGFLKPSSLKGKNNDYETEETLSHAAQAIVVHLSEVTEMPLGQPLASSYPLAHLTSPTILSSDRKECIAQAVFLALVAAAEGKESLQIAADSRGAVEAGLVVYELERIKAALAEANKEKTLLEILAETSCPYTQASIKTFFTIPAGNDSAELRELLLKRLTNLKIHAFLVGLAPGGKTFHLPLLGGWNDEPQIENAALRRPFTILAELNHRLEDLTVEDKTIIFEAKELLQEGLKCTVENYYQSLLQQAESLQEQIKLFLEPKPDLESSELDDLTQSRMEAYQLDIEQYLHNIEELYEAMLVLAEEYPQFNKLLPQEKPLASAHNLFFYCAGLVDLAASLIKEKKLDLSKKPERLSEQFFEVVKKGAITKGAISPELEDMKQVVGSCKNSYCKRPKAFML